MELKLRENERIIKTAEDKWHVILHLEAIGTRELFKTAYKRELFRKPVLTNQRLVLLENEQIDCEIALEKIVQATSHSYLKISTPYMKLQLRDGTAMNIVFECVTERVLFGSAVEAEIARRITKEWVNEINRQRSSLVVEGRTIDIRPSYSTGSQVTDMAAGGKYCIECGVSLSRHVKYCPHCGTKQP